MHERRVCDRREEKGPLFPQADFLVQLVRLLRRHESSTSIVLHALPSFPFITTVKQRNSTVNAVAQGNQCLGFVLCKVSLYGHG